MMNRPEQYHDHDEDSHGTKLGAWLVLLAVAVIVLVGILRTINHD